jgi:hypothetical protein
LIEILAGLFEGRLKSAARNNGYHFTEKDIQEHMALSAIYFSLLLRYLPAPEPGALCWSENIQIAMALFFHEEATKSATFNKYELDHAMKILPHVNWDHIYEGDEKDRLPRRSRIMKAYTYLKEFYKNNDLLVSGKESYMDSTSSSKGDAV